MPEVERAHGILIVALLAENVPGMLSLDLCDGALADIAAYASVTSWLLGRNVTHPVFQQNLEALEKLLREHRYVMAEDGSWHHVPGKVN